MDAHERNHHNRVTQVECWLIAILQNRLPEPIHHAASQFHKDYMTFINPASADELDRIIQDVNAWARSNAIPARVSWHMGEIRPATTAQRIAQIDNG